VHKRAVNVLEFADFCDLIELEIVDADSRSINVVLTAHEDCTLSLLITNPINGEPNVGEHRSVMFRRSRAALRDMLQAVLDRLDRVQPREAEPLFVEPEPEVFAEPPTFDQPLEPWLARNA
jgi:hypothetical protein